MLFGCCCPVEASQIAREAGCDFIECQVVTLIPDQDDTAFAPILEKYQASALPVRAFNVFLPGDLKVVGPEIDQPRVEQYVQRALSRVQQIGGEVVVFGSGRARAIPDGFPREQAIEQIVDFLHLVADVAGQTGVTIAIEPLNRRESNVINSVAEGVEIAQRVGRPSIRVLADFYHMDEDDEPLEHISQYKDWLEHIHVADTDRRPPGTGQYPYDVFAEQLRQAGYDRMVSIECRWEDLAAELGPAIQFLRQTLGK